MGWTERIESGPAISITLLLPIDAKDIRLKQSKARKAERWSG